MPDQSHLDSRYFVDDAVYNCPFCNRRHVSYSVVNFVTFDWTDKKLCHCYFVRCHSCNKRSMHLSFKHLGLDAGYIYHSTGENRRSFAIGTGVAVGEELDRAFFYSVPTSFFVLDDRVPKILRELLTEAEGCLKSNFLTGASACARKMVYELGVLSNATGDNYDERIKSLKQLHPEVEPTFFDTLLTIQQVTSTKVHEGSYDGWEAKHLRIILAALAEVMKEIYIVPALKQDRRKAILALRDELTPPTEPGKN